MYHFSSQTCTTNKIRRVGPFVSTPKNGCLRLQLKIKKKSARKRERKASREKEPETAAAAFTQDYPFAAPLQIPRRTKTLRTGNPFPPACDWKARTSPDMPRERTLSVLFLAIAEPFLFAVCWGFWARINKYCWSQRDKSGSSCCRWKIYWCLWADFMDLNFMKQLFFMEVRNRIVVSGSVGRVQN